MRRSGILQENHAERTETNSEVSMVEERGSKWRSLTLGSIRGDIRYLGRQLSKSPSFAIIIILTIGLGVGANTAIFTLIHAILLKPLPVADPASLYRIGEKTDDCCLSQGLDHKNGDFDIFSFPYYEHLREVTPEFQQLAAISGGLDTMSVRRGNDIAKTEQGEFVSGNYFRTFGIGAFAGRTLTDEDDKPGAAPAIVISYQLWRSEFGSDPSLVGSTIYVQSQPVTVAGIAARGFFGDRISNSPPAFWIPVSAEPLLRQGNSVLRQADQCWLYLLGRIRPGVAVKPLQQKISADLHHWLSTQDAYTREGGSAKLQRVHVILTPAGAGIQELQQRTGKELYLLLALTGFVLLVSCANIANLLLARGTKRRAEISMRMALGSARSRLIQQMLTESVLLGCLGGLAGLVVAYAGTRVILALAFPNSPHSTIHVTPSLAVLGFAFLLSFATGIIFGIVPAWITSHGDPADALRAMSRSAGDRVSLPQKGLIVFQAALSLVLLVGAGLLTKSLRNLEHQDFGLQTANRYVLHLDPLGAGYKPEQFDTLNRKLEQQFAAVPGMQSLGLALFSPLDGNGWSFGVMIPGRAAPGSNDENTALFNRVSPGFFAAVGEPVIRGRGFTQKDSDASPLVTVVNQAFVGKFFPKENPIGARFGMFDHEDTAAYQIVGVVANAKYAGPKKEPAPMFFCLLSQWNHNLKSPTWISLEVQTHYITSITMSFRGTPQNLYGLLRHTLADVNPNLTIIDLHSLDYQIAANFNQERVIARLTALFSALTLLLACVGLYGVTSYQVTQKTREIGVRMAFGANRSRVIVGVMRGALIQVLLGLAVGIPIALAGAHYAAGQLFAVKSYDPVTLLISVFALSMAAALAGFIPARRAASIDPMQALRVV